MYSAATGQRLPLTDKAGQPGAEYCDSQTLRHNG